MRYITLNDLLTLIPAKTLAQLSNDTAPATEPNMPVIERVVEGVEETVDGYLRQRYTLPFASVPTVVRNLTAQLARHELYARRPEGKDDLPPAVVRGYKTAIETLKSIQDGRLSLGVQATGATQAEPGKMRVRARRRVFGDDVLGKIV